MTSAPVRTVWKRRVKFVLLCAAGAFLAAAVLAERPLRETKEDLQREADAIHVDYLRVDRELLADIDDPSSWQRWVDCRRVEDEAVPLLREMRTQFGVLALSARLNAAVRDGCALDGAGLGLADLLERFDGFPPTKRWPRFAKLVLGLDDDAPGLREALVNGRLKAECAAKVVGPLRSVELVPDRDSYTHLVRHCWESSRERA